MGASAGAVAAAAAAARREREFLDKFRSAGATAPERAIAMPDYGGLGGNARAATLVRRGSLRAGAGGYWLDEPAHAAHQARQARSALVVGAVLVALLLVGLLVLVVVNRPGGTPANL